MSRRRSLALYLILSAAGAVLLVFSSLQGPRGERNITFYDSLWVGGLFITSCILGISLAMKPKWIHRISSNHAINSRDNPVKGRNNRKRSGHHPLCSRFLNHTIFYNRGTKCAGCLGMALGCVVCIPIMILFLFIVPYLSLTQFIMAVSVGIVVIAFSFTESVLSQRTAIGHVISNIFLIIGFLLVVAGVFGATKNPLIGTYAVIISFLWLDTRRQLSGWRHAKICRDCRKTCKAY